MLQTLTQATTEPVSLAEAKGCLRVIHASDDAEITRLIASARASVEMFTGLALAEAGYRYTGSLRALPLWPATMTQVEALQCDGTWAVDAAVTYDADRNRLIGATACQHRIEFTAVPGEVAEPLRSAILLRVQAEYEADANVADRLRDAADRLAWPYRVNLGV